MRRFLPAALALTLLGPSATAQDAPPPAAPPSPAAPSATPVGTGRITGHVLCDDTHRPARGALVTVVRAEDAQGGLGALANMSLTHVRTDGTYLVDHLPPGKYKVFGSLAGYLSGMDDAFAADPHLGATPSTQQVLDQLGTAVVTPGATASLNVTLQRGAAVSGRILFSDGSPAGSVNLIVEDTKEPPKATKADADDQLERAIAGRMFSRQSAITDDQGHFRIAGLRPGSYRLAATQPQWNSDPGNQHSEQLGMIMFGVADPSALRVYAGDTVHRLNAKVFDLKPGDEVNGVDITLPIDAFHNLHGTVVATDGRPINMGQLTLQDTADDQFTFRTNLAADGTFVFAQIPAGTYTLSAANPQIGKPVDAPPGVPEGGRPLEPIAAFGPGSLTLIVKDSDVEGLNLTLTEVPPPKQHPAADDVQD